VELMSATGTGARSGRRAIGAVAVLDDHLRSRIYAFIRETRRPVTREEVAEAVGISRKLAAFHLEKLVLAGLLRTDVPSGVPRRVGRAPKVYAPVESSVQVSIPARSYDDLALILVDAVVTEGDAETALAARERVATEAGRELGVNVDRTGTRGRLGAERALSRAQAVLTDQGYEPYRPAPDRVRLRNCPFHPLADRAPDLVCGVNVCFLKGFLQGLGAEALEAVLAPAPGECCVEIRRAGAEAPERSN
jgi:predicted ArsR family transcriptional regulator